MIVWTYYLRIWLISSFIQLCIKYILIIIWYDSEFRSVVLYDHISISKGTLSVLLYFEWTKNVKNVNRQVSFCQLNKWRSNQIWRLPTTSPPSNFLTTPSRPNQCFTHFAIPFGIFSSISAPHCDRDQHIPIFARNAHP